MAKPKIKLVGHGDPINRMANTLSADVENLGAAYEMSPWDVCQALANACGQILADAAHPRPTKLRPKVGKAMPREHAIERMDALRTIMEGAYDLRDIAGEG